MFRVKFEGICIVVISYGKNGFLERNSKNFGIGVKTETK